MAVQPRNITAKSVRSIYDLSSSAAAADSVAKNSSALSGSPDPIFLATNSVSNLFSVASNGKIIYTGFPTIFFYYDVATDGGTVGTITLRTSTYGSLIPENCVIINAGYWVTTAFTTTSTPTLSFGTAGSVTNLLAATSTATSGSAGGHLLIPDFATIADWLSTGTTAGGTALSMAIGTANIAAGAFTGFIQYIPFTVDTATAN